MLLTLVILLMYPDHGSPRKPMNIYWNTTNPLFSENRVPSIDVNSDVSGSVRQFDQMNLICPSGSSNSETHIIYSVNRDEFDSCEVRSSSPTIVAICDQPKNFLYFTITFRYFTPSPRQLEFKPGETYYFISTSAPGRLQSRRGGYCRTHNMRIQFRIGEALEASPIPDEYLNLPPAFWSKYWRSRLPDHRDQYTRDNSEYRRQLKYSSTQQLPYKSAAVSAGLNLCTVLLTLFLLLVTRL